MSETLVLSVGSDPAVLDTRDLILRSAGYIVVSVMSIKEAIHQFQNSDFDLIILCHTLPPKDSERLTCFIRASGSRIPIVCISGTGFGEQNAFADATLDTDPAAFLRTLEDVVIKHAKMQPACVHLPRNDSEVPSVKKATKSTTGIDQHEGGHRITGGTLSFLDRTKERASSD